MLCALQHSTRRAPSPDCANAEPETACATRETAPALTMLNIYFRNQEAKPKSGRLAYRNETFAPKTTVPAGTQARPIAASAAAAMRFADTPWKSRRASRVSLRPNSSVPSETKVLPPGIHGRIRSGRLLT